jgi:transcriptional regulator with XRE-family HTH domain
MELQRLIGETIRNKRIQSKITLNDLSILTGLNATNLHRIENGYGNPTISTIERIYRVLGLDPKKGLVNE